MRLLVGRREVGGNLCYGGRPRGYLKRGGGGVMVGSE